MNRVTMTARLFAAAAVAAAFAGALKPYASSAQSPEAYVAACPSSATLPPPPAPPTDAQLQQWQTQFAQGLSQSLNVPLAMVQNGVVAMTSPPDLQPPVAVQDPLVVASAQLGVSLDALRSAVQAADQTLLCPPAPGGAGQDSPAATRSSSVPAALDASTPAPSSSL